MTRDQCAEVLRLAQNLARNCGYAVFPCRSAPDNKDLDKTPTWPKREGGQGFKDASTDPDRIAWLWQHWPGELIGIATGAASNLWVLDIDRKHPEACIWWQGNHHRLLPTRAYATRSGGIHLHHRDGEGIGCTTSRICKGVDTRGTGGYAIHWFSAGLAARKTFLALHVSYGVAQSWPRILGRRVKQAPVLYLIAEGEAGIGKRVNALVRRYGRCDAFHVIAQPIDLLRSNATTGDLHDVIEAAKALGVGLIDVDTVSRAMMGGDENGPADMGTLAANLNILRHETGAHVMGIHHGTQADGTKSRGHSILPFGVDAILQVEWNEEAGVGDAIIGFCRDDAIGKLGAFRTEVVDLGIDADGDQITTLVISECDKPDVRADLGKVAPSRVPFYDALISAIARSGEGAGRATLDAWEDAVLRRGLIERPRDGETYRERADRTRDFRKAKSDLLAAKWIAIEGSIVSDLKGRWR